MTKHPIHLGGLTLHAPSAAIASEVQAYINATSADARSTIRHKAKPAAKRVISRIRQYFDLLDTHIALDAQETTK